MGVVPLQTDGIARSPRVMICHVVGVSSRPGSAGRRTEERLKDIVLVSVAPSSGTAIEIAGLNQLVGGFVEVVHREEYNSVCTCICIATCHIVEHSCSTACRSCIIACVKTAYSCIFIACHITA